MGTDNSPLDFPTLPAKRPPLQRQFGPDEDVPERTRRRAHNLRQHFGVLLVLSNRLAKKHGNESMLKTNVQEDGSATVAFTVDLDSAGLNLSDQ